MAANKQVTFGPVALTTTLTTNILSPGTTTGGTGMPENVGNLYFLIKHIRIVNKTGTAATVSLWKGATAGNVAGTELIFQGYSVPANSYVDWYGALRLDSLDTNKFIVGGSGTATALSFQAEGEIGID